MVAKKYIPSFNGGKYVHVIQMVCQVKSKLGKEDRILVSHKWAIYNESPKNARRRLDVIWNDETCHSVTFIVLVNSHQRWKQTRNRVCFHLWCELTLALWCHSFIWNLWILLFSSQCLRLASYEMMNVRNWLISQPLSSSQSTVSSRQQTTFHFVSIIADGKADG